MVYAFNSHSKGSLWRLYQKELFKNGFGPTLVWLARMGCFQREMHPVPTVNWCESVEVWWVDITFWPTECRLPLQWFCHQGTAFSAVLFPKLCFLEPPFSDQTWIMWCFHSHSSSPLRDVFLMSAPAFQNHAAHAYFPMPSASSWTVNNPVWYLGEMSFMLD